MATMLKPETEARIADLAERLGLDGAEATEQVIVAALDRLDAATPPKRRYAKAELHAMLAPIVESAQRWREENPYDDDSPPSRVWQEELYDEQGLPK